MGEAFPPLTLGARILSSALVADGVAALPWVSAGVCVEEFTAVRVLRGGMVYACGTWNEWK